MKRQQLLVMSVIIALVVALLAGAAVFLTNKNKEQQATITLKAPVTVDIFTSNDASELEHGGGEEIKPVQTITQSQTLTLDKGSYIAISHETNDYVSQSVSFELGGQKTDVTINPDYTEAKINAEFDSQRPAIQQILTDKYPLVKTHYTIAEGQFFLRGEWYGTELTYKGPAGAYPSDTLRVILHKEGDSWQIATDPPQLVISNLQYPQIPKEVISDVNNLLSGQSE